MKTAVSIPDEVFTQADKLARQSRRSRSAVYGAALKEYLARHAPDDVTETMNRVCADLAEPKASFVGAAARRILEGSEW